MHTVLYTIVIVLIIIYGFKAYQNYPSYKNSILPTLFPNYFEFFWRMFIRKDASNSSYLNKSIGNHKLSFATIENRQHQVTSKFVLFFYNKGIAIVEYLDYLGTYSGNDEDRSWIIKSNNKKIRITNPIHELQTYKNRIQKMFKDGQISSVIAIKDDSEIDKIQTQTLYCKYKDVITTLNNIQCEHTLSESEIQNLFDSFNQKRSTLS
jgi:hypothetical protein